MVRQERYQVWCKGVRCKTETRWPEEMTHDREEAIVLAAELASEWTTWVWDTEEEYQVASFQRGSERATRTLANHAARQREVA